MADPQPNLYLLHGEDEYGIALRLAEIESGLGDPTNVALNTSRINGESIQPDQLFSIVAAMPFLASHRVVIVNGLLSRLTRVLPPETNMDTVGQEIPIATQEFTNQPQENPSAAVQSEANAQIEKEKLNAVQKKFLDLVEKIPQTTILILVDVVSTHLTRAERGKVEPRWFIKEVANRSIPIRIETFELPKGPDWISRLQAIARKYGGQISPAAASVLFSLLDGDVRLADQEIQKLLAFVNYQRQIELEDVQAVTEDVGQGNIFKLVEALGDRNGRLALSTLGRLLEYQDDLAIYGMIVRQFRLLILTRAMLDSGRSKAEIIKKLKIGDFVVDRLVEQLRRFSVSDLDRIYHRLLEIDEKVKTSQVPRDLALQTFVSTLALR